jgi:hypothetical protein
MLRVMLFGFVALAMGCSSITYPEERVIGVITGFNADDPHVAVPDTVAAGESFAVTVRTYGGGCTRKGETETEIDGLRATVTPYDIQTRADICTDILKQFTHTASLRFNETGTARVVVRGRGHTPDGALLTIERTVVVR